jgi:GMP synthase-like glutamine amidotransferase
VLDIPAHLKGLASNIVAATKKNKKLKVLGICFGHQLLSKYFGSKLEKKGRIGGIERV